MNTQTSFPRDLTRGKSEQHARQETIRPAHSRRIGSLTTFFYALAVVPLCVQGPAQQAAKSTSPAAQPTAAGRQNSVTSSVSPNLEVLSDTQGVDFGPYLKRVSEAVRRNWYTLVPEEARAPELKRGKVVIEFAILPDGKIAGMKVAASSGDVLLDRAAWGGITASNPFASLPEEFHGPFVALRFRFFYNPQKAGLDDPSKMESH
jgi:TonB family protein